VQCIESVCCVSWPCFVVGDFNAPAIDWSHLSVSSSGADIHLLHFATDNEFTQIVNSVTRKSSILDLVLTNEPNTVFDVVVGPPFRLSDQCSVNLTIALEPQLAAGMPCSEGANEHLEVKRYRWNDADYNGINSYLLNVDWSKHCSPVT